MNFGRVWHGDWSACSDSCTLEYCGNGVVEAGRGEACDDGNLINGDGCESDCTVTAPTDVTCYACGRLLCAEVIASPLVCSFLFADASCEGRCDPPPVCGNGITEGAEECDDGNVADGDGCENDCTIAPGDRGLCETPDPADLPPGTRFRDYDTSDHISLCQTETSLRYLICSDDGTITVNVNECPEGAPCAEGDCVVGREPTCSDTDRDAGHPDGVNPGLRGTVTWTDSFGTIRSSADVCSFDGFVLFEAYCRPDQTSTSRGVDCRDFEQACRDGACVPVSCACSRTEAAGGEAGYVTNTDCGTQHDICRDNNLIRYTCGPAESAVEDPAGPVTCPAGCANRLCLE